LCFAGINNNHNNKSTPQHSKITATAKLHSTRASTILECSISN